MHVRNKFLFMQNLQQQNTLGSERIKIRSTQNPTATMKRNACEKVADESRSKRESIQQTLRDSKNKKIYIHRARSHYLFAYMYSLILYMYVCLCECT